MFCISIHHLNRTMSRMTIPPLHSTTIHFTITILYGAKHNQHNDSKYETKPQPQAAWCHKTPPILFKTLLCQTLTKRPSQNITASDPTMTRRNHAKYGRPLLYPNASEHHRTLPNRYITSQDRVSPHVTITTHYCTEHSQYWAQHQNTRPNLNDMTHQLVSPQRYAITHKLT